MTTLDSTYEWRRKGEHVTPRRCSPEPPQTGQAAPDLGRRNRLKGLAASLASLAAPVAPVANADFFNGIANFADIQFEL